MTLIAEDLLLLLLDGEKGTLAQSNNIRTLLGGALLSELAIAGRVEVGERPNVLSAGRVAIIEGSTEPLDPLLDPLLREALATIGEKPRTAQDLVDRVGKGIKEALLERLAERGLIHPVAGKVLGVFPRTTWPASDPAPALAVREQVQGPLVQGLSADERTSALIALLAAVNHAHKVVDRGEVPVKEIKARAKSIAEGDWAAKAVKDAVTAKAGAAAAGGA